MRLEPLFGFGFGDDCQHFNGILGHVVEHAHVISDTKAILRT